MLCCSYQAEDGIRDGHVTGVQTCALPICKGATNYAIGLSSARIVEAILRDENAVLNVAPVLSDFHGIDGVALSVPSIVNSTGAHPILETPFSAQELGKLRSSAEALMAVAEIGRASCRDSV